MVAQVRRLLASTSDRQVRIMLHGTGGIRMEESKLPRKTVMRRKESRRSPRGGEDSRADRAIGMERSITRRDFLNASLLASGGLLLNAISPADLLAANSGSGGDEWTGYGGVGDYAKSNGNTLGVLEAGHGIRDGLFENPPANLIETGETYDCVVVGGGISGLAGALIFKQRAGLGKSVQGVDNHPIFSGEANSNEFLVDEHRLMAHQGSAFFPVPYPHSFIARFYEWIGVDWRKFQYQTWSGASPEIPLTRTPYQMVGLEPATYGIYFGAKFG